MPKIAFQKEPDKLEFFDAEEGYLIAVCHEFAKLFDEEIYTQILNKKVSIFINDDLIKVDDWYTTQIQENDKIVIVPNIEGEDSGILQVVVGVVIAVASYYFGPAGYAGATSLLGEFAAEFGVGLGISIALGGLSQLLFQPDLPSLPSISSSKQTQTYNWSGIKTVAQVDTPIPIVYGKHPVGGNVISLFIESDGNDSYLNMLLALCEGEIEGICQELDTTSVCTTSDQNDDAYKDPAIKIDDQPLKFYDDVEWWYRKGTSLPDTSKSSYNPDYQNIIPHFDGARIQYEDGREVTAKPNYIEYVTTKEVDQVYLNFVIPQLYNGEGSDLVKETVRYKVQYSTDGNTFYDYEGPGTYKYEPSVSGNRSQYCTCDKYRYGDYKYSYKEPTYKIRIVFNNVNDIIVAGGGTWPFKVKVDILDENNNFLERKTINGLKHLRQIYEADGNESLETVYTELEEFYVGDYVVSLDHNVLPGDIFTISSSLTSAELSPTIVISGKTKTGIYNTIRIDFSEMEGMPGRDIYYLRATRVDDGKSDSLKIANNLILQSVIEIVNGQFIYPHTALLGLRIKATGQLSGSPPNIVTTLKGTKISVPDLSGSEAFQDQFWDDTDSRWEYNDAERTWDNSTYTTEYSNNSMLCVRDLVLSERYGLGSYYSSSDIDTSEVITTIRECWKRYDVYPGEDYLKWWDSGKDSDWTNWWRWNISPWNFSGINGSYDSSARTITVSGTGKYTTDNPSTDYFNLKLTSTTKLKIGQQYDLSITLSGVDYPITIDIYGRYTGFSTHSTKLGTLSNKTNGTHSVTISIIRDYFEYSLNIYGIAGSSSYTISDISLTKTTTSYEHYHTWNGVIESGQSALAVLLEMCDAFRCWPIWHSGKINFVSDRDTTHIHTLSVGDTEKFSQTFTPLSELPYRVIGQFTDEARDFRLRSLVSKSKIPDLIKINEKNIGLKGLTSKTKAERELKFKHGKATRAIHNIAVTCGIDLLHGTAGDIIRVQDDLPQWGHGGNIINYTATNLTIDSAYTFSNAATNTFIVRYQGIDNSQLTATIDTTNIVTNASLQILPVLNLTSSPCELSVFSLDTTGQQSKEFRILSTNRSEEDKIDITCIEHISGLYDSEATLAIVSDYTPLKPESPNIIPRAPVNIVVAPLPPSEGMGFAFSARPASGDYGVIEIIVQLDRTGNREFETIGTLIGPNWNSAYSDSSLKFDYSYRFRFYCKTAYKIGQATEISVSIPKNALSIDPPKGLRIKGKTLNSNQFDDKDITIIWDAVGLSTDLNYSVSGYKINVYKNSISNANLLRTDFKSSEEYFYSYAMNVGDNGTANGTLVFELTTLTDNGMESVKSSWITVSNSSPSAPSGLTSSPWMRGAKFDWSQNTETDLENYTYRLKIGQSTWGSWTAITNTEVQRGLSQTEVDTYGAEATILIQLKAVDVYSNESATVSDSEVPSSLNIDETDISNFAITSSKIFNKIPVLESDSWSNHTVAASEGQWNQHNLYYNGTLCVIASGHTSDKYIYWKNLDTSYSTSASHPAELASPIGNDDFIIAVNINGVIDLAWNAVANQIIGSAYIQDAAINSAKINDLAVTSAKINDLAVTSAKIASLAVLDGHIDSLSGDKVLITSNISINATTYQSQGIQLQYNSGTPRAYFGDGLYNYFDFTGTNLNLSFGSGGNVTIKSGGDLILEGNDANPGQLIFDGGAYSGYFSTNASGDFIFLMPSANSVQNLHIGEIPAGKRWDTIDIVADSDIDLTCYYSSDQQGQLSCNSVISYLQSRQSSTKFSNIKNYSYSAYQQSILTAQYDGSNSAQLRCYAASTGGLVQYNIDGGGWNSLSGSYGQTPADIEEGTEYYDDSGGSGTWNTVVTTKIFIPSATNYLYATFRCKYYYGNYDGARFRIDGNNSTVAGQNTVANDTDYSSYVWSDTLDNVYLDVSALSGWRTLTIQLKRMYMQGYTFYFA